MSEIESSSKSLLPFMQNVMAQGATKAIITTLSSPLERTKLLLQLQNHHKILSIRPKTFEGTSQTLSQIASAEGFSGLMKGNLVNILKILPTTLIHNLLQQILNQVLGMNNPNLDATKKRKLFIINASLSGIGTLVFTYPIETVLTRMMTDFDDNIIYSGFFDCLRQVVKEEGFLSLYSGFSYFVLHMFLYKGVKRGLARFGRSFTNSKDSAVRVVSEGVLDTLAFTVAYPLDTMRRRANLGSVGIPNLHGFGGYYHGAWANMALVFTSSLLKFGVGNLQNFALE